MPTGNDDMDNFIMDKRIILHEIPGFENFSMQFHFSVSKKDNRNKKLIFAKQDKIFEFDYETELLKDVCIFENPLSR